MIGDRQPDRFKKGDRLTASLMNTIVDSVVAMLRRLYGATLTQPLPKTVVLDAALAAATNALTSPGTATASVLQRNSSGNLEDSGNNITVVNRFENIDLKQYTIATVEWIDGEWRVKSADCDALGSWP